MENDLYDVDLDDEVSQMQEQPEQTAKAQEETKEDDSVRLSKDEYTAFKQMEQERTLKGLEADFKREYKDFDMQKVTDKLLELDKANPGFAKENFTPVGLENIYLKHFHGKQNLDDEYDVGRGSGGAIDTKAMAIKINKGEASESEKRALYAKFF